MNLSNNARGNVVAVKLRPVARVLVQFALPASCPVEPKENVNIQLLGGDLELEWRESDNHVYKKGPAVEVFNGVFELK